jgi:hypothetical protein
MKIDEIDEIDVSTDNRQLIDERLMKIDED